MRAADSVARARAAFESDAWKECVAIFQEAEQHHAIDPEDLDRLATAAYLIGEDATSSDARSRAYELYRERGEPAQAARSAFWLAFTIIDVAGQQAQAGGWLARAQQQLHLIDETTAEHGLLLCAQAFQHIGSGDVVAAGATFAQAAELGLRFGDADLLALARHGEARVLIRQKSCAAGVAILDDVMIAVTRGKIGPMVAGVVYCSVISACHDMFDVRRANEWTSLLSTWCAKHPDMVPFRGQCLVRRSELLQLRGEWHAAIDEAQLVCDQGTDPASQPVKGMGYYQLAELHRLRGEFVLAESAYRRASQLGKEPQPGLALLWLAQGQTAAAMATAQRLLSEPSERPRRARLLAAAVEIMLAEHALDSARASANELAGIAAEFDAPFLRALADELLGAVSLAAGNAGNAIGTLRSAVETWQGLSAPYQTARTRTLLGLAFQRLGDHDGALLEFEAALEMFESMGAAPDVIRVAAAIGTPTPSVTDKLTGREVEVLRLVATGMTNKRIAAELAISEKTIARHVSNIFMKLGLSTRAAATAFAYEHRLV